MANCSSARSYGCLHKAAEAYDRIVDQLEPARSGVGGTHYRDFVGDLGKQREHAETVLKTVKNELDRAAALMVGAAGKTA